MSKSKKQIEQKMSSIIEEGEGRFPWWIWVPLLIWILYALLIAPFDLTSPGR